MSTDFKIKHDDLFHIRLSLIKARSIANQLCLERERRGLVSEANSYVHEVRNDIERSEALIGEISNTLNLADHIQFNKLNPDDYLDPPCSQALFKGLTS
jgi:hypothetical protein